MGKRKFKRGSGAKFVQIEHWVMDCEAWQTMKPGPRALYVELKRRFNGSNNGRIFLSTRDAAKALNVNKETAGKYFAVLREHGFITITQGHCLGPSGQGQADLYALTEQPIGETKASKDFRAWKMQKPVRKTRLSLSEKTGQSDRKTRLSGNKKPENPDGSGQIPCPDCTEKPDIYTSNHIPAGNIDAVIGQALDGKKFGGASH